ncbi:MAG: A/G-specific adenine glycosylase [Bacteroidota bacterium]
MSEHLPPFLNFTKKNTHLEASDHSFFRKILLDWYEGHHRPLPWKGIKEPYLIWLSEIILQQTRVEQGWAYFEKFRTRFPNVHDLANASTDEVMKLWEGLGYYSRARNLHHTARQISSEFGGRFPNTYAEILKLKGVGPYTAAAISSFAFDLPVAVVDGNVYRVLARIFGLADPIDTGPGKKKFAALAQKLLDSSRPADYNQAIMDFGATQCTPAAPACPRCPYQSRCLAYNGDLIRNLPVKSKKMVRKTRYFNYFVVEDDRQQMLIEKRIAKDIWRELYQFPMLETDALLSEQDIKPEESPFKKRTTQLKLRKISLSFKQVLTHQVIISQFIEMYVPKIEALKKDNYIVVDRKNLDKFAFPKLIDRYIHPTENLLF